MALLDHARSELQAAKQSLARLERSKGLDDIDAHWKGFLHHLERIWSKTIGDLQTHPKWQGWTERGRVKGLRAGEDPLLSYLRNARGAEEHTVVPIASRIRGGIGIGAMTPGGSIHIDKMGLRPDGEFFIESRNPLRIEITPAKYQLQDVVNRGMRYAVPAAHLGAPLTGADPVTLARAGLAFYEKFLADAAHAFTQAK